MLAPVQSALSTFGTALKRHNRRVDHACRRALGITAFMWRILDQIVSLGALALAGYAIDQNADPVLSLTLAAIIISGPKIVEWWLVREDFVDYEDVRDDIG